LDHGQAEKHPLATPAIMVRVEQLAQVSAADVGGVRFAASADA
jgi:hypothetical protein